MNSTIWESEMKPDGVLRLHLAEEEPVKTPPDVELGLKYWRELNATPNRWARFDAAQFLHSRVVSVEWGHKYSDGFQERTLETIILTMNGDEVYVTKHTHS